MNYKKIAALVAIVANLSITCVGILILFKILPYNLACGGRLTSYENAVYMVVLSIIIQLFLMYFTLVASGILKVKRGRYVSTVILKLFIVYFCVNIVMNLMGETLFEKIYASIVCIVQIICFFIILK